MNVLCQVQDPSVQYLVFKVTKWVLWQSGGVLFFLRIESSVPASGSQWFRDQLTQRVIQSSQSVAVEDVSMLSEACDPSIFVTCKREVLMLL